MWVLNDPVVENTLSDIPTATPPAPIATMTFDETEANFGTIAQGELVQHVFTFTNTGDLPLVISGARGSCGCTVPAFPREPILPGESGSILVEFNSKNKSGARNQKVTITANTEPSQTVVYLKGFVSIDPDKIAQLENELPDPETRQSFLDAGGENCLSIYPNPTSEQLHIDTKTQAGLAATVRIFSQSGKLMTERHIPALAPTETFKVSHYPPGLYLANIQVAQEKPTVHCFAIQ